MKFLYNFFFGILFLCSFNLRAQFNVKVLLGSQEQGSCTIYSKNGFIFKDPSTGKPFKTSNISPEINLDYRTDGVYLEGKKLFSKSLLFEPIDGYASYNDQHYDGSFLIQKSDDKYCLINSVPLEEYVLSVLKTESWPGWPVEVNKAFAIMTRSYVLHQIMLSHQKKLPYDVRNSNHHQTYTGVHSCAISKRAVDETKGLFLAYKNLPILAMFDICCGGVIPADIEGVVDFKKAPYLARDYACTYCKNAKPFRWIAEYSLADFIDMVQLEAPFIIKDIKDVKVLQTDSAGLIKKVAIKTMPQEINLTADQMYRLSNKIKSYVYKITKKGKKIIFKGKGFGHHIGLCQWGAREMVRVGFDYREILSFYYPDTDLMRFVEDSQRGVSIKGGLCQDIKGILSAVQLRSRA